MLTIFGICFLRFTLCRSSVSASPAKQVRSCFHTQEFEDRVTHKGSHCAWSLVTAVMRVVKERPSVQVAGRRYGFRSCTRLETRFCNGRSWQRWCALRDVGYVRYFPDNDDWQFRAAVTHLGLDF